MSDWGYLGKGVKDAIGTFGPMYVADQFQQRRDKVLGEQAKRMQKDQQKFMTGQAETKAEATLTREGTVDKATIKAAELKQQGDERIASMRLQNAADIKAEQREYGAKVAKDKWMVKAVTDTDLHFAIGVTGEETPKQLKSKLSTHYNKLLGSEVEVPAPKGDSELTTKLKAFKSSNPAQAKSLESEIREALKKKDLAKLAELEERLDRFTKSPPIGDLHRYKTGKQGVGALTTESMKLNYL